MAHGEAEARYLCSICQEEEPSERGYRRFSNSSELYVEEDTYEKIYNGLDEAISSKYSGTINLDDYSSSIEFDEGNWYYPTPDEDWHQSDRNYTTNPSFKVKSETGFVRQVVLNNSRLGEEYDFEYVSDKGLDQLREIGFFSENSYEAKISGSYYGDEFDGWTIDKEVKEKAVEILTEEAINQASNDY